MNSANGVEQATGDNEDDFAHKCANLLPDTSAALAAIMERYGWEGTLEIVNVFPLHLKLLSQIGLGKQKRFRVPCNDSSGDKEDNIIADYNEGQSSTDLACYKPFNVDASEGQPTLLTAMEMMLGHYISIDEKYLKDDILMLRLTNRGQGLFKLFNQYTIDCKYFSYNKSVGAEKVRNLLAEIIYTCISKYEKSST